MGAPVQTPAAPRCSKLPKPPCEKGYHTVDGVNVAVRVGKLRLPLPWIFILVCRQPLLCTTLSHHVKKRVLYRRWRENHLTGEPFGPSRFPGGIKSLADYVHGLGLKFGVCVTVIGIRAVNLFGEVFFRFR